MAKQAETPAERTAVARDVLAEELRRIEAAVEAAGGDQFISTPDFIRKQAVEIKQLRALVMVADVTIFCLRPLIPASAEWATAGQLQAWESAHREVTGEDVIAARPTKETAQTPCDK